MVLENDMSLMKKLQILSDAAKYDVACTSSGVHRDGVKGELGNAVSCGIFTVLQLMEDAYLYSRYFLRMNVSTIADTV